MNRSVAMALVAGLLLAAAPAPKTDAERDAEKLQGAWRLVSWEQEGKQFEVTEERSWVFDKDTVTLKGGGKVQAKARFKIDTSQKPRAIDLSYTEPDSEEYKGRQSLAIYEVDKEALKCCSVRSGEGDRPKEFATKEGTKHMLIKFEKGKP
jgi:uncharacterized protein (TIGR03067 family)